MRVLLALLSLLAASLVSAQCEGDPGCQAYVWGYPLWQAVNARYLNNRNTPAFNLNSMLVRVSAPPAPAPALPQLTLCNASLCSPFPNPLNPSPIIAPNVDTIYGAFTWDLGPIGPSNPGAAVKFVLPANTQTRYASVLLYNHYTDVLLEVSSLNQPLGVNTVLCLVQVATHPACAALPAGSQVVVLPRYGFSIIRVYSTGGPSVAPPCGVDGCGYLLGSVQNFGVIYPPTSVKFYNVTYGPYMDPALPGTCPYVYTQAPCGASGNKNAFWDAICVAIADNPLTGAEATYVDNTFGGLGIHSTGCTSLNYPTLTAGITTGYNYVTANIENTGVTSGPWYFFPFTGTWNAVNFASTMQRAVAAARAIYINANSQAAYWIASKDSNGNPLNGAWGATYKLVWKSSDAIVDAQRGFWSVTLYDIGGYLYIPPAGTDLKQYAIRGTGLPTAVSSEIHFSNTCVNSNCVRATPGLFALALRAYAPLANVLPNGGYAFPDLIKCDCSSPCN